MKLYQGVWLTVTIVLGVACTLYAIVVFPIALVITAAISGALVAAAAGALGPEDSTLRQLWVRCSRIALNGAGIGVATIGMMHGTGWSGLLLILVLAAASPHTIRWLARRLDPSTAHAGLSVGGPQVGTHHPARVSLTLMSDHQLSFAWRLSWLQIEFTNSPGELLQLAQHRSALLDEMHHRNPEGFSRWLMAAPHPSSDPPRI